MRFSINFFTSIGLGGLTDNMREHLANMPKIIAAQQAAALAAARAEVRPRFLVFPACSVAFAPPLPRAILLLLVLQSSILCCLLCTCVPCNKTT